MSSKWGVSATAKRVSGLRHPVTGDEFWVEFRERLTVGEKKRMTTGGFRGVTGMGSKDPDATPSIDVDWTTQAFGRMATYLVDWSLADDNGNKMPLGNSRNTRLDAIMNLDEDVYDVIEKALNAHVEAMEESKKAQAGAQRPSEQSA